jgi:X-X-X-Leu-X-X-Gly heptad repeat protein
MIGDLADGASELASGLGQAADRYDQLDQSLIRSLSGS